MLNFRNTNIFFSILLVVLIGIHMKYGLPFYIYPLLLILYSLVVFYGCYYIGSNFFIKIICSANTDQKEIAISFDDGPVSNYTTEILQLLKQDNIKATFFCIGNRIAGNENIVKKIKDDGHIIGNHSYSHHFWFDIFSSEKMLDDLKKMDQETERVTGIVPKLFRPPYGVTNPNLKKAIIKGNYIPVGWSVRSMDTVIRDEKKLLDKINRSLKPGAVFLFHDTSKTTVNILPEFIREVKKKGYNIIPLDKLLHLVPYV
ncbi:MAG TPA: polysaccharide deacetylase family protein [Chitinophagaceae bacterium]|nr:polysaccharide deacetylase family protein [Chitinophagaceae bacterium]